MAKMVLRTTIYLYNIFYLLSGSLVKLAAAAAGVRMCGA